MTSRNTGRNLAAKRTAERAAEGRASPRPAGLLPAKRAVAAAVPVAGVAARGARVRPPRRDEPAEALPSLAQGTLRAARPRGAYRTSSRSDLQRIEELKVKLGDPDYMDGAILRIATVLSARLTLR